MEMKKRWPLRILKGLLIFGVGMLVLGFVVMGLWNAIVPDLFRGPVITFWQAAGLLLLSHVLLRGWGPWRHSNGWRRERWRGRLEEKLAAMTPEEREKFKEEWRRRCGKCPESSSEKEPGIHPASQ